MSAINRAFKIRDTATGLFFSGSSCHAVIGTRFVKRDSLDFVISRTISKNGKWPNTWEVVTVELSETETEIVSPQQVDIDFRLRRELPIVLNLRGSTEWKFTMVNVFLQLRREHRLADYPFFGQRTAKYQSNWPQFRFALKLFNIEPPRIEPAQNGVVLFTDETSAIAARMADLLAGCWDIKSLRVELAERLGVPVEEI